jgi:hypothetical protein
MRNGDSLARAMSHEGKTAQRERKSKRERAGKSKVMKNFRGAGALVTKRFW